MFIWGLYESEEFAVQEEENGSSAGAKAPGERWDGGSSGLRLGDTARGWETQLGAGTGGACGRSSAAWVLFWGQWGPLTGR